MRGSFVGISSSKGVGRKDVAMIPWWEASSPSAMGGVFDLRCYPGNKDKIVGGMVCAVLNSWFHLMVKSSLYMHAGSTVTMHVTCHPQRLSRTFTSFTRGTKIADG